MKTPLISVIVPVYNREGYLDRCIGSILAQTYGHLEILLVDDGSTDRSGTVCDGYAARDARIRVLHRENGGVSAARNMGLDCCQGDYIAFVDSDDFIRPDMYRAMLEAMEEHGAAVCVCQWQYLRTDGTGAVDLARVDPAIFGTMSSGEFARFLYRGAYENGVVVSPCNKLYRRDCFRGLRFSGRYAEDDGLHTQLLSREFPVYVMQEQFYIYAENPDSLSHRGFRQESLAILDILRRRTALFRRDPFLVRESKRTYCNLYIEYFYRAKDAQIPMPGPGTFRRYVRDLVSGRECGAKFALRMGLFLLSPALYRALLVR